MRAGFAPDVVIASGRGLHDRPVAEHALTLVLAAARRLHRAFARAAATHEWATDIGGLQPEPSPGVFSTLRGAQVVIWGYGSIGQTLEPHLTALGATVTGAARSARQEGQVTVIDESGPADQLARDRRADHDPAVDPGRPAARSTPRQLAALPPHAWVINVGRGDAVDEPALMEALRSRRDRRGRAGRDGGRAAARGLAAVGHPEPDHHPARGRRPPAGRGSDLLADNLNRPARRAARCATW